MQWESASAVKTVSRPVAPQNASTTRPMVAKMLSRVASRSISISYIDAPHARGNRRQHFMPDRPRRIGGIVHRDRFAQKLHFRSTAHGLSGERADIEREQV